MIIRRKGRNMRDSYIAEMPLLRFILSTAATRAQIKALLAKLTRNQLNFISKIAFNILKGVIPLTKNDKETLRQFVRQIRSIGQKKRRCTHICKVLTVNGLLAILKVSLHHIEGLIEK